MLSLISVGTNLTLKSTNSFMLLIQFVIVVPRLCFLHSTVQLIGMAHALDFCPAPNGVMCWWNFRPQFGLQPPPYTLHVHDADSLSGFI